MDWPNKPLPFKVYSSLEPIPLPREFSASSASAHSSISSSDPPSVGVKIPDLSALAQLLYYSAGVTRTIRHNGGEHYFRAAACTGALYHIELYLVCGDLSGLEAGLYHFGAHDFSLRRLRSGDYRPLLIEASGGERAVAHAPATIVFTSTFWRNAWKYQSRAYRHAYWDGGTLLANLLAVAASHNVPAKLVLGYADGPVNDLLGLDTDKEVSIALVPLGHAGPPSGLAPPTPPLELPTMPLSKEEVDYPAIRAMHEASNIDSATEAAEWHGVADAGPVPEPSGRLFPLDPPDALKQSAESVEEVIARRGSTRRFSHDAIELRQLSAALLGATQGMPADFLAPGTVLNDLYLIVNNVGGLPQGSYAYHRDSEALELLMEGDFRTQAGYLGLEQELPADASANIFFLTSLDPVLQRFGNRGYRAAQLEAAVTGGKLYISAYAQRFGASGLTFFDDEVTDFFSPHAAGKSVMFLVALGHSAKRSSGG